MKHTRLWVVATIILLMTLVGFALSVPHTHDIATPTVPSPASTPHIPSVALHDAFKKGLHTITGSIEAPDPCTPISVTTTFSTTSSPSILIAISMPADTGICLQESATLPFSTTIAAPAKLPLRVEVNGSLATTTSL